MPGLVRDHLEPHELQFALLNPNWGPVLTGAIRGFARFTSELEYVASISWVTRDLEIIRCASRDAHRKNKCPHSLGVPTCANFSQGCSLSQ